MKTIFLSKTFWVQVIALASLLFPPVREWVETNPIEFGAVWAALNVLVRFATHDRVSISGSDAGEKGEKANGSGGVGTLPLIAIVGTTAALLTAALPSCSGAPLKASLLLPEGRLSYSAKGGIEMEYAPGYGERPTSNVERRSAK
jgi:hypothetical protein